MKVRLFRCFVLGGLCLLITSLNAGTPLVVLHTNDTHSQIEPYGAEDARNESKGGILRREALIRSVRLNEPNVLVVDAGDFVQGTPYFNFFKGDVEVELMNRLGLDAVTLGNHEFDNGLEPLASALKKARFDVVCSNYSFKGTPLETLVVPWKMVIKGTLKIGIVSANINLQGLVSGRNHIGVTYQNPIQTADSIASWLKSIQHCDLVICLSHLGYNSDGSLPDDLKLASSTTSLDVIIGGHTHTFMKAPVLVKNKKGADVIIHQSGRGGVLVGRLDLDVTQIAN
jgi:5'-nucleotidase